MVSQTPIPMRILGTPGAYPAEQVFCACLHESDSYAHGTIGRQAYIDASVHRLHRIVQNMLLSGIPFRGPTLDVASGWGMLFPALCRFFPQTLPYQVAELSCDSLRYDGVTIPCTVFECEKDTLPFPDETFGLILFLIALSISLSTRYGRFWSSTGSCARMATWL